MKKIAIASLIALAATAAGAAELGVTGTRDYAGANSNHYGLTVGQKFKAISLTGGFARTTDGAENRDRYSLAAGLDVARFGPATMSVQAGAAHLGNQRSADGYALFFGAGATMPLTKNVSVGLDLVRQYGQDRVQQFDGNRVTAGVRYKF